MGYNNMWKICKISLAESLSPLQRRGGVKFCNILLHSVLDSEKIGEEYRKDPAVSVC
jgi:hypothetical protein